MEGGVSLVDTKALRCSYVGCEVKCPASRERYIPGSTLRLPDNLESGQCFGSRPLDTLVH